MRQLILLLGLACCMQFVACTTKTETSTAVSTNERNRHNFNSVYRAIETGDMSNVDSFIAEDIVEHNPPVGMEMRGRDSIKRMLADMRNHFTNLKFENIATATDGDYAFALVRMTGTPTDGAMGFPPNVPVNYLSIDVVKTNSQGQATDHWVYLDPRDMMKMMGGAPPMQPSIQTDTSTIGVKIDTMKK
jgi:ketosteroid isomerase-like protein